MDRTLLPLSILSGVLIAMMAPHAMFTLTTIVVLSAIATRGCWTILRSFEPIPEAQRVVD